MNVTEEMIDAYKVAFQAHIDNATISGLGATYIGRTATKAGIEAAMAQAPTPATVPTEIAGERHKCAASGFHDHEGCTCTDAELAARATVPSEWVMVPKAAIDWLMGEGPDPAGLHFGEFPDDHPPKGAFWWRDTFRSILEYACPPPASEAVKVLEWIDNHIDKGPMLPVRVDEMDATQFEIFKVAAYHIGFIQFLRTALSRTTEEEG